MGSESSLDELGIAALVSSSIAFHAQQAAEKALKGVLVGRGVEFSKTDHPDELIELVQDAGIDWPFPRDQGEALTPYMTPKVSLTEWLATG